MLGNLLGLAPIRVSGPNYGIVAVTNEFDGSLDFITEVDSEAED
jgi:hypothetical protein